MAQGKYSLADLEDSPTEQRGKYSLDDLAPEPNVPPKLPQMSQVRGAVPGMPSPQEALKQPDNPINYAVPGNDVTGAVTGFFPTRTPKNGPRAQLPPVSAVEATKAALNFVPPQSETETLPGVGTEVQAAQHLATPGKRWQGATEAVQGAGEVVSPMMGPAAVEMGAAPSLVHALRFGAGMGAGFGAQPVAEKIAEKAGAGPEQQKFWGELAFWAPQAAGLAASQAGYEGLPQEPSARAKELFRNLIYKGGGGSMRQDFTPEEANAAYRQALSKLRDPQNPERDSPLVKELTIAHGELKATRGQNLQTDKFNQPDSATPAVAQPPLDEATKALAQHDQIQQAAERVANGQPPVAPPPPPPSILERPGAPPELKQGVISQRMVDTLAQGISKLPEGDRPAAIQQAHETLSQVLLEASQKGPMVGPDGKLIPPVKDPEAASKVAIGLVNNAVGEYEKQASAAVAPGEAGGKGAAVPPPTAAPKKTSREKAAELAPKSGKYSTSDLAEAETAPPASSTSEGRQEGGEVEKTAVTGKEEGLTAGLESKNASNRVPAISPRTAKPINEGIAGEESGVHGSQDHGESVSTSRRAPVAVGEQNSGVQTGGREGNLRTGPESAVAEKGTPLAKGDSVTLSKDLEINGKKIPAGTPAKILYSHPNGLLVRAELKDGTKISRGVSAFTKAAVRNENLPESGRNAAPGNVPPNQVERPVHNEAGKTQVSGNGGGPSAPAKSEWQSLFEQASKSQPDKVDSLRKMSGEQLREVVRTSGNANSGQSAISGQTENKPIESGKYSLEHIEESKPASKPASRADLEKEKTRLEAKVTDEYQRFHRTAKGSPVPMAETGEKLAAVRAQLGKKSLWQRTRAEIEKVGEITTATHQKIIQQAMDAGKDVPTEVLKDYPDLKPVESKPVVASKSDEVQTIAGKMNLDEFEKKGYSPEQVTQSDWVNLQRAARRGLGQREESGTKAAPFADYEEYHKQAVKDALAKDEDVDPQVLKDYPELRRPEQKEPWEQTFAEQLGTIGQSKEGHGEVIKEALAAGKLVPKRVLEDYPNLQTAQKARPESLKTAEDAGRQAGQASRRGDRSLAQDIMAGNAKYLNGQPEGVRKEILAAFNKAYHAEADKPAKWHNLDEKIVWRGKMMSRAEAIAKEPNSNSEILAARPADSYGPKTARPSKSGPATEKVAEAAGKVEPLEARAEKEGAKRLTPEESISKSGKNFEGRYLQAALEPAAEAWDKIEAKYADHTISWGKDTDHNRREGLRVNMRDPSGNHVAALDVRRISSDNYQVYAPGYVKDSKFGTDVIQVLENVSDFATAKKLAESRLRSGQVYNPDAMWHQKNGVGKGLKTSEVSPASSLKPDNAKPPGFKEEKLLVKVPDDGTFVVPNHPAAIDRAIDAADNFAPTREGSAARRVPGSPKEFNAEKYIVGLEKEVASLKDDLAKALPNQKAYIEEQLKAAKENLAEAKASEKPESLLTGESGSDRSGERGFVAPELLGVKAAIKAGEAVGEFIAQDVAPALKKAGIGLKDVAGMGIRALYPRIEESNPIGRALGVAAPADAVDALMKVKGDRAKNLTEFDLVLKGVEKMFDRLPEQERIDFIDRIQTGQKQPDPQLADLADMFKEIMDGQRQAEEDALNVDRPKEITAGAKPPIELSRKENYFHNWWETPPGKEPAEDESERISKMFMSRRPLEGTKGYNKKQSYTLASGIEAGGKPVTTNPVRILRRRLEDGMKFVTARRAWHELGELDLKKFVKPGTKKPEGFDKIDDKIAKVWFPATMDFGGKEVTTPHQLGEWYVESNTARLLNNMLSVDKMRGSALGSGLLWLKNAGTAIELGVSPFHAVFSAIEALSSQMSLGMLRSYNLGVRQGNLADLAKGVGEMIASPLAPITLAHEGMALPAYIEARARLGKIGLTEFGHTISGDQPHGILEAIKQFQEVRKDKNVQALIKKYPDLDQLIDDMFDGGLVVGQHRDYQVKQFGKTAMEAFTEGNPIGGVLRGIPTVLQGVMSPLFNHYIPALKYSLFFRLMSEQAAEHAADLEDGSLTRQTLARRVADSVENRFGELNFDNLFLKRTVKSAMQFIFRSATYKLGTGREFLGAAGGQTRNLKDWAKDAYGVLGGEKEESGGKTWGEKVLPKLDSRASWIASLMITTALIGTVAAKLLTHKYPWEWIEDDKKEGMSTAHALMLETTHPRTGELDSRGKPVRVSLPTYWKDVEHAIANSANYVISSLSSLLSRGIDTAENRDYWGNYVYNPNAGLLQKLKQIGKYNAPIPFSISNFERAKQQDLGKTSWLSAFGFPKAPSDLDFTPAEKMARDVIKAHESPETPEELEAWREKHEAFKNGKLPLSQAKAFMKRARESMLQRQLKNSSVSYADARKIYEAASPDEKKELAHIMQAKRARLLQQGRKAEVQAAQ